LTRTRSPILIALLLLGGALLASCGDDDDDAATATATEATATATEASADGATVSVSLSEWAVTPDPSSVAAGEITFTVANEGSAPHEFVIIRSDAAADALPTDGGLVPEADVDFVTEIEEFPSNTIERLTIGLTSGNYVLICNIAGHYGLGMRVSFTVN
jgi:uncharacterized cupredoxin-like copper-binding protein